MNVAGVYDIKDSSDQHDSQSVSANKRDPQGIRTLDKTQGLKSRNTGFNQLFRNGESSSDAIINVYGLVKRTGKNACQESLVKWIHRVVLALRALPLVNAIFFCIRFLIIYKYCLDQTAMNGCTGFCKGRRIHEGDVRKSEKRSRLGAQT